MRRIKKYLVPHGGNEYRPYLLRAAGVLFLLTFVVSASALSQFHRIILMGSDFIAAVLPGVLVDLANENRDDHALKHLSPNPLLEQAARRKAEDMARKSYFAHTSPEGVTPWYWFGEAGYSFAYAGENLAVNFDDSAAVDDAWMNSPGHRANILSDHFTEVGIATARGTLEGADALFVVQMFGSPAKNSVLALQRADSPSSVNDAPNPALIPVTFSAVLGKAEEQTFVAVKDANAVALEATSAASSDSSTVHYASLFERLITSPTKLLALVYLAVIILLLATLACVWYIKHSRRMHHTFYILLLLLIVSLIYYGYRFAVLSSVVVQ